MEQSEVPPDRLQFWKNYKQHNFNQCIRKAKQKFLKDKQDYMLLMKATNAKNFWQEFDTIAIANDKNIEQDLPQQILKPDGTLASNIDETLQTWSDHFLYAIYPLPL